MLTSITLPEGLQTIGGNVFNTCEKLPSITIPKSVTTIGDGAFAYCSALKDVTVFWNTPLTIPSGVFAGITPPTGVTLHVPAGTGEAYQGKDVWKEFTIVEQPWGDLSTGLHWAYDAATHTLTITNPNPGTPKSMPDFGPLDQPWNAFKTQIETVTIGDGVSSVGKFAFTNCAKLATVTLPDGLKTIGKNAFGGCEKLATVTLPEGLQTIGEGAFTGCFALSDLTIPKSVETIEEYAFYQCGSLTNVTLPEGLQTIGGNVFNTCEKLPSITIPKSVTTIGDGAFAYCSALKDVTVFWNTPLTIPSGVFAGITPPTGVTLHVPAGTGEAYQGKDVWKEFTIVEQPWGDLSTGLHWAYDAANHSLTITNPTPDSPQPMPDFADQDNQPWKAYRGGIQKVTIGAGVNHVGKYAFTNCSALTSITLPEGLKTIGNYAFGECAALASISIPNSVTAIADGVFASCKALASITIPNSVTAIADGVFAGCKALKSVTLPEGLQTIGKNAFLNCAALASISIPNSVTAIGDFAFQGARR